MTNLDSILKSRDITVPKRVCRVKSMVFPVVMYRYEIWTIKKAECWKIEASKMLESSLDCKEIQLVNPKGNQPWIFIWRNDAEAPILWPPDAKSQLIGKDPGAGKDWEQEEKEVTEDETVGWLHWLNRHEFEQTPGDNEGLGSLVCCSPWGCKELDTTEQLNSNKWVPISMRCMSPNH